MEAKWKDATFRNCFFRRSGLSCLAYLVFLLTAYVSRYALENGASYGDLGVQYRFIFEPLGILILVFCAYSTARAFAMADKEYKERYFSGSTPRFTFRDRAEFVWKSPEFYVEVAVFALLAILLPWSYIYSAPIYGIFYTASFSFFVERIVTSLVFCPILAAAVFWGMTSALEGFVYQDRKEKQKQLIRGVEKKRKRVILSLCFTLARNFAIYGLGCMILPQALMAIISVVGIILCMPPALWITILVFTVGLIGFQYMRAISKRRELLRGLQAACRANRYELFDVKSFYLSVFRPSEGANFTIQKGDHRYDCKLICSRERGMPMTFDLNGWGTVTRVIGFRSKFKTVELLRINRHFHYAFEAPGKKILLLNPVPSQIFVSSEGRSNTADVGSRVGAYKIYNASGFINAIERNCLER